MTKQALSGIRVLDLTHYVAGPYFTRLLAGLGAEVIKIEKPESGDGLRKQGPFAGDDPNIEKSLPFLFLNPGKKSVTLNLKTSSGIDIFKKLVEKSDIVVENFEPRVMPSLGIDYETLSLINPGIVMTSISSFGQDGPYRDYKATEIVEYAMSGLMYITGEANREPLKLGLKAAQMVAGQNALAPTLAALYSRNLDGEGQHVDISIMEYCTGLLEYQIALYIHARYISGRVGSANEKGHPWGLEPCRNGWIVLATQGERFRLFAEKTGRPELMDPKFESARYRIENRDLIDALLMPWLIEKDKEELFHMVGGNIPGCAAGMVLDIEEIVNLEPLKYHQYFEEVDHPKAGPGVYPGPPFRMSKTPWRTGRSPLLGEHNEAVYGGLLGYTGDDLIELKQIAVI
jgi:crotonobetainyl-CoA:carnitine CoA-transferase CaiB-like acyl-CoA transferase